MSIDQMTWLLLIISYLNIAEIFYLRKRQIDRRRARLRYQMNYYIEKDRERILTLRELEEIERRGRKNLTDHENLTDALRYYAESRGQSK